MVQPEQADGIHFPTAAAFADFFVEANALITGLNTNNPAPEIPKVFKKSRLLISIYFDLLNIIRQKKGYTLYQKMTIVSFQKMTIVRFQKINQILIYR